MSRSRIGVGLIGCGYAARLHLPALRHVSSVRVVGVADVQPGARERISRLGGGLPAYEDYRELLARADLDAVGVLTPPYVHVEMTCEALAAGKHVLLEKPVAATLGDADRMLDAAARSGVAATVCYNLRFHAQLQEVRRRIRAGALGEIELLRCIASSTHEAGARFPGYRSDRTLGGGVLIELAVHHYDLWPFLLGDDIVEVSAMTRSRTGDDETATVTCRMASGILATSDMSERAAEQQEFEVYGSAGRLRAAVYRVDGLEQVPIDTYDGSVARRLARGLSTLRSFPSAVRLAPRGGPFLDSFRAQWQAFADAILAGEQPAPTFADGRRSLQVALAAVESATSGRSVHLAPAGSGARPG